MKALDPANNAESGPAGLCDPAPRRDRKLFLIACRSGRLANRLVLFANFIALAEEQGDHVVNVAFHSYAGLFETTRRDIFCQYPVAAQRSWLDVMPGAAGFVRGTRIFFRAVRLASLINERVPIFGPGTVTIQQLEQRKATPLDGLEIQAKIRDATLVFVDGWTFRASALVRQHAAKIRAYFQPIEAVERSSREPVDRLRKQAELVIGVHIRQNDYSKWKHGRYFYPTPQYAAWMHQLIEVFSERKVSFLVCSDEPQQNQDFQGLSVGFAGGSPVVDLCSLAKCDYIFGPPSTYSQWASFYGDKPLLHVFNRDARIDRESFRVSDLDWIL